MERGIIKKADDCEFVGHNRAFKSVVTGELKEKATETQRRSFCAVHNAHDPPGDKLKGKNLNQNADASIQGMRAH